MFRAPSAVVNNTRSPLFFSVSLPSNSFSSSILRFSPARHGYGNGGLFVSALKGDDTQPQPQPGVDFFSLEEVHDVQRTAPQASLAGVCENEINLLINVQYSVSYVYHSMFAYFHRENAALKGFARFFKESSEEKRDVAEKLMEFQNKRGGWVKLESIIKPSSEYDHDLKGNPGMDMHFHTLSMLTTKAAVDLHMMALKNNDIELIDSYDREISRRLNQFERVEFYLEGAALPAMELALSLERITNEMLLHLHKVGEEYKDLQLTEFIKTEFLDKQVKLIEKISEYVAELRRVGKGQGAWHSDQKLVDDDDAA